MDPDQFSNVSDWDQQSDPGDASLTSPDVDAVGDDEDSSFDSGASADALDTGYDATQALDDGYAWTPSSPLSDGSGTNLYSAPLGGSASAQPSGDWMTLEDIQNLMTAGNPHVLSPNATLSKNLGVVEGQLADGNSVDANAIENLIDTRGLDDATYNKLWAFWRQTLKDDQQAQGGLQARQQQRVSEDEQYLNDNRVKAYLDTLAWAEGYWNGAPAQYNSYFGDNPNGKRVTFDDYSAYPTGGTVKFGGQKQTPAGRLQINEQTYDQFSNELGLTDFSPHTQNLMGVQMSRESGALAALMNGDLATAVNRSGRWASMPKLVNGAWVQRYRKQKSVPFPEIQKYYQSRLNYYSGH